MATITEVRFAHEQGALSGTLAALESVEVRVLPETSTDPDRTMYLFTFEGADADAVADALEADETVATVRQIPEFTDPTLWKIEFAPGTELLAPRVTHESGFVIDARTARLKCGLGGWHERWLLPDREAIHAVWAHARETGFEFNVVDLYRQGRSDARGHAGDALTEEQHDAVLTAYRMGYFADPREASLESVAEALGHSQSAIGGRIKRGMKSLVEATLVVDRTRR